MRLVLASGSPRRRELLNSLGLDFDVELPDVDESRRQDEPPGVYVERIAVEKARAVAAPDRVVLAADTAVVHEGKVLGKPGHPEEARAMLRRLQNDRHEVFTGIAVASWNGGAVVNSTVDVTEVAFLPMTDDEIADYVSTGEPMDKAGAYALQGAGGRFIESVKGSPFTVIGLPIHLISRLISPAGMDIRSFRHDAEG
ncbi:MAG: septum formation protein Maf [Acidobacteria bacterium]|nr:MAG: septum formation protein Maf [Acidobacteriota bacterium]